MKISSIKKRLPTGRHAVIGVPFLWLFLFFLLPFAIVLKISFAEADVAIPRTPRSTPGPITSCRSSSTSATT